MRKFTRTLFLMTVLLAFVLSCSVFSADGVELDKIEASQDGKNMTESGEAAETKEASEAEPVFDTVSVCFSLQFIPTADEGDVVFALYDEAKQTLLDKQTYRHTAGNCWTKVEFKVPEYEIGKKFAFCLESGAEAVTFNEKKDSEHIIQTYSYPNEEGSLDYQTEFYMELHPIWSKKARIEIPGVGQTEFFHYIIDNEVYVTEDLLSVLGINCTKSFEEEKPYFTLSTDSNHVAVFYNDDIYATFGGSGENLSYKVFLTDSMPFVPLSRIAQYFECDYSVVSDDMYQKEIALSISKQSEAYKAAAFVNEKGYESDTDYLIWVSKKNFTVNVYLGSKGNWRLIKTAACAIGAPSSPTIEGIFKYHQYQDRWQYSGYYCGPIMRFYRGYALHSTLIRNNGTPYDNRVGVRISHGCVRLRPDDIKWLVDYVTLGSTVVVTA